LNFSLIVKYRGVEVSLIIAILQAKDRLTTGRPFYIGRLPLMLLAVRDTKTFEPGIDRLIMEFDAVISC